MGDNILTKYTVQEKLNKMDIDVIEITPTTYAGAVGDNNVIFEDEELTDIVMVDGGRAIIQSITVLDDDDNGAAMDLFFHTRASGIGSEAGAIDSTSTANLGSIKAVVSITTYSDGINWQFGHKENIGAIIKTADISRKIYVTAINRSGSSQTYTAGGLILKIGIVRD